MRAPAWRRPGIGAVLLGLVLVLVLAAALFASPTEQASAQSTQVLVSNLGQPDGTQGGLGNDHAQAFTTGSSSISYTLSSVDMEFANSQHGAGLSDALTATIRGDSGGNPSGTILWTLTNPAFVSTNAKRTYTFTAPGDGIDLAANTTYWFVLDVDSATVFSGSNGVRNTASDDDDTGGAPGWSIADDSRYRSRGSTGGWTTFGQSKKIRINGVPSANADGSYTVPENWALIPSGLNPGDKFRLLFITSTTRASDSTDIADYDTHVQTLAAAGHTAIQPYSSLFKVVGSTATVDARDHTDTTGTGHPIYWLGGNRLADDYADFYDNSWGDHGRRDESGNRLTSSVFESVLTGSEGDGTKSAGFEFGGASGVNEGSTDPRDNPFSESTVSTGDAGYYYGISPVFRVPAPSITANADGSYTVPENWALIPSGINPGDRFRLLFQTSTRRDATSTDIAVYDTFVQTRAAAGHTAIQPYSSLFKVVGSTASVDARDHTGTTGTGHPIYWLNGPRVAANYAGFWSDNWENWADSDRRKEDGTAGGGADWHWTGTDEDGTKHSNPLGNTGTNVRRGQFSTGASSRNPISHWNTDKTQSHTFYALSPVFSVRIGPVPEAYIALVPLKESYQDESVKALYHDEEPHGSHEHDWHATKESTPLTFRVEHVQWPYNERGVNYDIVFNIYLIDRHGFVGGSRYVPDTYTLPANQPYVDIALPVTPVGNNDSGTVTIKLMGGSKEPGEQGAYTTGRRDLTYFVLDAADSGLGDADTVAIPLHQAAVIRNAVLHTNPFSPEHRQEASNLGINAFGYAYSPEYRQEGEVVAFDIELRHIDTGDPLNSLALLEPMKVYYKVIGCEGIIQGGSHTQVEGVGNIIDTFTDRNGYAGFGLGQSKITVSVPTVNDNVDGPDCNLQVALTDSDYKTLPEGGKPYVLSFTDSANNPNYYNISYAFKPATSGRLNDQFFAPPFDVVGICDCDGNADDSSMISYGEAYHQHEIAVSELQSGHEGEPVYFELQAKLPPGDTLPVPLDVSVTISSEGDIGVPTSTQTVTIPVGGRVTLPEITTTDDADGLRNSSVTATINQSGDYVIWPERGSATVELTESNPWPNVHVEGYIGNVDGEDSEGYYVYFELTAEDPVPTEALDISVTTTVLGDFGITGGTQTITIGADDEGHAEIAYLTTDDNVDEPDGEVTVTINPGHGYVVDTDGYDTATVEILDNDDGSFDGKKAKDHPLVQYADLVTKIYDTYIADHNSDDIHNKRWKQVLKGLGHADYVSYSFDAMTSAQAKQLYDDNGWGRWREIEDALKYAESYFATVVTTTPEITITGGSAITEGGTASFTIHADPAPTSAITVNVGVTQDGSWGASGPTTVSVSGASTTYTITTGDDQVDEADGSVTATVNSGTGYTVGSASSASVAVSDDDDPPPTTPEITITGGSGITEGGSASFTISANPAPTSAITVNVGVSETGDWGASGLSTVSVSGASTTYTITTSDDEVDEADGSVTATINSGSGYTVGSASSASVTVADNDAATVDTTHPLVVYATLVTKIYDTYITNHNADDIHNKRWKRVLKGLGHADYVNYSFDAMTSAEAKRIYDDNGWGRWREIEDALKYAEDYYAGETTDPPPATDPVITISGGSAISEGGSTSFTISANPAPSGTLTVNIDLTQTGGYGATGATTVSLSGASATYTVSVPNNNLDQARGSVTVTVDTGTGYSVGSSSSRTVYVNDNDVPVVTITGGSGITEGGTASFSISADPAPASPITVNIGVSENGDWGATGAATISVSGASTTYTIATSDDQVDEADGSVTATVEAGSGYTLGSPSAASVNVADDDDPPPATPVITISGGSGITEGGTASFTITANPVPASPITINVDVSESGNWGASGAATVSVSGESTSYTIATTDDQVDEADGSVTATVQAGAGYTVGTPASASVNVADDDVPEITISGGSGITEGGTASFTITANPVPASPITVNIGVSQDGDFGASGPARVSVSSATTSYTVTTADDDADEADGSVTATVQAGAGYTVGTPASASVNVADDDDPPVGNSGTLTVAIKGPIDRVTPGGTLEFTVTLSDVAQQDVTLAVSINPDGMLEGMDYKVRGLNADNQLVISNGESEGKIYVDILEDAWIKESKLIDVNIELVSGAKEVTQNIAHGGINP